MTPLKRNADVLKGGFKAPSPKRVKGSEEKRQLTDRNIRFIRRRVSTDPGLPKIDLKDRDIEEMIMKGQPASRPIEFTYAISPLPKALDQGQSGKCWMTAGLGCLTMKILRRYDVPKDFELSQSYLFFWDKFERANLFLNKMIKHRDKSLYDQKVASRLKLPLKDNGKPINFIQLVKKYGVVPSTAQPENAHSMHSMQVNHYLNQYLRQFALKIEDIKADENTIDALKEETLAATWNFLVSCLGEPPESFQFDYVKEGVSYSRNVTPLEFYNEYISKKRDDLVFVTNMPQESAARSFHRFGPLRYNKHMAEGEKPVYLNLSFDTIVSCVIESLKQGDPVCFSSDVCHQFSEDRALLDANLYNLDELFGKSLNFNLALKDEDYFLNKGFEKPLPKGRGFLYEMTREDLIDTGEIRPRHVMVLCAVKLTEGGEPTHWLVLNSWGTEKNDGYLTMTHEWFLKYTLYCALDKRYLPKSLRAQSAV